MRLLLSSPFKYRYRAFLLTPIRLASSFIVRPFMAASVLTTQSLSLTATPPYPDPNNTMEMVRCQYKVKVRGLEKDYSSCAANLA